MPSGLCLLESQEDNLDIFLLCFIWFVFVNSHSRPQNWLAEASFSIHNPSFLDKGLEKLRRNESSALPRLDLEYHQAINVRADITQRFLSLLHL